VHIRRAPTPARIQDGRTEYSEAARGLLSRAARWSGTYPQPVPITRDDAVCVRVWDWSETSQTVSLFGRGVGMLRCVAKGARREGAAFSGGLEVLTRGEMMVSIKGADALSLLTAWDLRETFPAARRGRSAFFAGFALLAIVQASVHDADPHPGLFDALVGSSRLLGSPDLDRIAVLRLLWAALDETGHRPELLADVRSGEPLTHAGVYGFVPRLGGLAKDGGGPDEVWRVRAETVGLLRGLDGAGPVAGDAATVRRAVQLLASYSRWVFGAEAPGLRAYLDFDAGAEG